MADLSGLGDIRTLFLVVHISNLTYEIKDLVLSELTFIEYNSSQILGMSISSRTTVTKVNKIILDRGSSFIGFLWRVRRAVWPWDSSTILAFICWLLVLIALWMGIFLLGVGLLVFSRAGVSVHPIPLLESSHGLFLNPSLLSSYGFGSLGWVFAERLRRYFSLCEFSLVCDQYLYCSG